MEGWHDGDSALQVALDNAASSFGQERIPVHEAAAVLRSLAGEKVQLLAVVARAKLEDHRRRGYNEQVAEMYAAAALLLAASMPSSAEPFGGSNPFLLGFASFGLAGRV